jgi:hypothetical protein
MRGMRSRPAGDSLEETLFRTPSRLHFSVGLEKTVSSSARGGYFVCMSVGDLSFNRFAWHRPGLNPVCVPVRQP